jgi:hypothetical protein
VVKKYATRSAHSKVDPALRGTPGSNPELALTTEIKAPRKGGFLHITASSDTFGAIADSFSCQIAVDGTLDSGSFRTIEVGPGEDVEDNCGTNTALRVGKGSHTVQFQYVNRASSTTVGTTTLDVLWVPLKG